MNLASSFVNGFVNAAFGQDKLLTEDGNKWLYKNKDHGKRLSHADTPSRFLISFLLNNLIHFFFKKKKKYFMFKVQNRKRCSAL